MCVDLHFTDRAASANAEPSADDNQDYFNIAGVEYSIGVNDDDDDACTCSGLVCMNKEKRTTTRLICGVRYIALKCASSYHQSQEQAHSRYALIIK